MSRTASRLVAGLTMIMLAGPSLAVDTDITIRVLSRDAKFVGSSMGGARVVLRDAENGQLLARGVTAGGTGDTATLMYGKEGRRAPLTANDAASFQATLDLERPRLMTVEVSGPQVQQQSGHAASATQWVVPGRHLSAGDGWVIELPGFVVNILAPPARVANLEDAENVSVSAQVVMMCGCPVTPGGLWDATQYEVGMLVSREGEETIDVAMTHAGTGSRFSGELPVSDAGLYDISVYAYDPRTGNTGLDRTTIIVD